MMGKGAPKALPDNISKREREIGSQKNEEFVTSFGDRLRFGCRTNDADEGGQETGEKEEQKEWQAGRQEKYSDKAPVSPGASQEVDEGSQFQIFKDFVGE
jgi:hypothetical protein